MEGEVRRFGRIRLVSLDWALAGWKFVVTLCKLGMFEMQVLDETRWFEL